MKGFLTLPSGYSVDQTVSRIQDLLAAQGIKLFSIVDHSGEAQAAGLTMPPTKLLIFGSPAAGTPAMLAAPSLALDLPLKILVAQDESDRVSVTFNTAEFLQDRHNVPAELAGKLAAAQKIVERAVS